MELVLFVFTLLLLLRRVFGTGDDVPCCSFVLFVLAENNGLDRPCCNKEYFRIDRELANDDDVVDRA